MSAEIKNKQDFEGDSYALGNAIINTMSLTLLLPVRVTADKKGEGLYRATNTGVFVIKTEKRITIYGLSTEEEYVDLLSYFAALVTCRQDLPVNNTGN